MSVEEILKRKKGVCEHFTLLYNALLNSIGIQAIYVRGFAFQRKEDLNKNTNIFTHAWTLAKINTKWIPLDSTWGILEGKLPVTHVFETYFKFLVGWRSNDRNCDIFGILVTFRIIDKVKYKSIDGGVVSIIFFVYSIFFTIYLGFPFIKRKKYRFHLFK